MSIQDFSSVRIFSWDPQALEQVPEGRGMEGMCELSGSCSSPTLISDASVHKGTQRGLANQLCMKKEKNITVLPMQSTSLILWRLSFPPRTSTAQIWGMIAALSVAALIGLLTGPGRAAAQLSGEQL